MNRNKLKTYAPQARRDFIQAVTQQAAQYGLTAKKIEPMTEKGDVVVIAGQAFPKAIGEKRKKLEAHIQKNGFGPTMEAMAYTWFNRLVAIRFMELHGYLEHGFRVLSHPAGGSQPEIVEHAQHVDLPGLDQQKVVALKLDGTKEEELYRLVLLAQCNALHKALPFLFEKIDDETELLLPDKLLHSDSLIRKLVNEIDEEDWQEVEIIGWLYQFYISERKDEVIGAVVASEDIPAATQLFTPNWIVKYLVQNTLGRQWLATYPQSALRQKMEYYIEPAEQTPEVQEQLKAITPTELNPEELTLLDPACGSGHILVEAYDLFKAIYEERGRRPKDIPTLILTKNLFGLEIDDRAAQLAAFALMMKARADDRRIFDGDAKPNVLALQDSKGLDAAELTHALNSPINKEDTPPSEYLIEEVEDAKAPLFSKKAMAEKGHVSQADIATLLELFENAKTFGSLIQIPSNLAAKLPEIENRLNVVLKHGDLTHRPAHVLKPLLQQACLLARNYDAVVANPPYMGRKGHNQLLKAFASESYDTAKADLFAMFMARGISFVCPGGYMAMITLPSWMFLSSFESIRTYLTDELTIESLLHIGRGIFGIDWGSAAFSVRRTKSPSAIGKFFKLHERVFQYIRPEDISSLFLNAKRTPDYRYDFRAYRDVEGITPIPDKSIAGGRKLFFTGRISDFAKIPGRPIAYWLPVALYDAFTSERTFGTVARPKVGMQTANNERFLRFWWEVSWHSTSMCDPKHNRWVAYSKGGDFRKWWGNNEYVLRYEGNGQLLRTQKNATLPDPDIYEVPRCCWSDIAASKPFAARQAPRFSYYDIKAHSFFPKTHGNGVLAYANSSFFNFCISLLNPGLNFQVGDARRVPCPDPTAISTAAHIEEQCVELSRHDWNSCETSWDFVRLQLLDEVGQPTTVSEDYRRDRQKWKSDVNVLRRHEIENNGIFVQAFNMQGEVATEVPLEEVTLNCNPHYRYGSERSDDELEMMLRRDCIADCISFATGCMMGRFSLDKPGLIYAHCGNQGFDPSQYKTFRADEDGIIPVTEFSWFPDDAASRFEQFVATAWPTEHLDENLKFVAESIGAKKGESPQETIRRYLAADFYKHHLSMYKKRPIYWLFSSGKQRGFQALVYLHRYNEGTLARMRTEYVMPLIGKMTARISHLADDIAAASSTPQKKRLETEKATITKQLAEVQAFEEKLRHCADQRISLDLDDGVKVNYGKFGELLAEVKAICGTKDED